MTRLIIVSKDESGTAKAVMKRLKNLEKDKKNDVKLKIIQLPVADYIAGLHFVERKRASDFIGSILDNRVWGQAEDMRDAAKDFNMTPVVLIEGSIAAVLRSKHYRRFNPASMVGVWDSLQKKPYGMQVVHSPNSYFTVLWLLRFARDPTNEEAIHAIRKATKGSWPLDMKARYILEGWAGVGGVTSNGMLSHYKTLRNIFHAAMTHPERDNRLKKIADILDYEYGSEE
jgi:ERCC4-type nuclease